MSVREARSDIVFLSDAFRCVICNGLTRCEKTGNSSRYDWYTAYPLKIGVTDECIHVSPSCV